MAADKPPQQQTQHSGLSAAPRAQEARIRASNVQQVFVAFTREEYFVPVLHMTGWLLPHQFTEVAEVVTRLDDVWRNLYLDLFFDNRLGCSLCRPHLGLGD